MLSSACWRVGLLACLCVGVALAGKSEHSGKRSDKSLVSSKPAASGAAKATTTTTSKPDDDDDDASALESPSSGSRAHTGTMSLDSLPSWLMPIWGAEPCSRLDGYACGFGMRICKGYFLGPIDSITKAEQSLSRSGREDGPPGMFMFNLYDRINISRLNADGWQYKPAFLSAPLPNIGFYWIKKRVDNAEHAYIQHDFASVPEFETSFKHQDGCKVLSLGASEEDLQRGMSAPLRYWRALPVEEKDCKLLVCRFKVLGGKRICSKYGDLGAPIICGDIKRGAKVKFLVNDVNTTETRRCVTEFTAARIGPLAERLAQWMNVHMTEEAGRDPTLRNSPYPPGSYVGITNNFPRVCEQHRVNLKDLW